MAKHSEIADRYKARIEREFGIYTKRKNDFSWEYETFRSEALGKRISLYEFLCNKRSCSMLLIRFT